jgi:tRNA(Phe) wybutosine-synthesizing methylase Tyw3
VIGVTENGWTTNEKGMDWIQHFEKHTKSRSIGTYRLLVLDGHESHHSDAFEEYCKEHNIVTLCMPAHSSHILQPLNVGCFSPLKKAYGRQIENMMRGYIMHITKDDFFPAFREAHFASMTESNIRGGFRGAGLISFDSERVISTLNLKLKTPTPPNSRPGSAQA